MIIKNAGEIDLSDTIITIIYLSEETKDLAVKRIFHSGEFDEKITLKDIRKKYPFVNEVISESGLHGEVYRYGNHGKFWERIGQTEGYA